MEALKAAPSKRPTQTVAGGESPHSQRRRRCVTPPSPPALPHPQRFSALGEERGLRGHSAAQVSRGAGADGASPAARWGLWHAWPPKRLKKVAIPPFKMRGRAPSLRRAWLCSAAARFINVPTGTWLWTCQKPRGHPRSGKQKTEPFKILEARKDPRRKTEEAEVWADGPATSPALMDLLTAAATPAANARRNAGKAHGFGDVSISTPAVPGTVTVMVLSSPGTRRTRVVPHLPTAITSTSYTPARTSTSLGGRDGPPAPPR